MREQALGKAPQDSVWCPVQPGPRSECKASARRSQDAGEMRCPHEILIVWVVTICRDKVGQAEADSAPSPRTLPRTEARKLHTPRTSWAVAIESQLHLRAHRTLRTPSCRHPVRIPSAHPASARALRHGAPARIAPAAPNSAPGREQTGMGRGVSISLGGGALACVQVATNTGCHDVTLHNIDPPHK